MLLIASCPYTKQSFVFRNACMLVFLLPPCHQSSRLKPFSALIMAPGISRGRTLPSAAVGKTVAFCFHAEFCDAGTKAQIACIGASRCRQIKPSRWCCDLVGLPVSARVSLAVCPSAPIRKQSRCTATSCSLDLGHDARMGYKCSSCSL